MEGRRIALLVATDSYQDTGLSRLAAPASDARQLSAVLRNTGIAGFEVTRLHNKPHHVVGRAIGNLYRNRRRDDLTLLYFTGHGVKDEDGHLYLAMTDTDRENLQFTGVQADQIRAAMEACRSRQNVLILDCCYAGAFPAGLGVKGDTAVHALEQLGGRGSVVLTSSDAMQLSFEGNQMIETGPASLRSGPGSLFTRFLIEGLRTGEADLDGDGEITLDELYSYVYDRVIEQRPQQRPMKKENVEGHICFAWNIHWTLPSRITDALSGPYAPAKLSTLEELRSLHNVSNAIVKQRVLEAVRVLAEDDSKSVSEAANEFLSEILQQEQPRAEREAQQAAERQAAERAEREAQQAEQVAKPSGAGDRAELTPGGGARHSWKGRLWVASGILAAAVATAVAVILATASPSSTHTAPPSPTPSARQLTRTQLRLGDCLTGNLQLNTISIWPSTVEVVPCGQKHIGEVFYASNYWAANQAYPGDSASDSQADAECDKVFATYIGIPYSRSKFSVVSISPNSQTWASGDRSLQCIAYWSTSQDPGGAPLYGSIRGSAE